MDSTETGSRCTDSRGGNASSTESVALLPRGFLDWVRVFGPGAIIASLTIGTGELIFSVRAGALFRYDVLWVFVAASVLKWALVFGAARHMVLSGAHPIERWRALPAPASWLPVFFLLLAIVCFPAWIGFHASVVGSLIEWVWGVDYRIGGALVATLVFALALLGGYRLLERAQLVVVCLMLLSVLVAVLLLGPDWLEVIGGLWPRPLAYPDWVAMRAPEIAETPIALELGVYVAVIGGSSYDYLAYVSYLREKRWGWSSAGTVDTAELSRLAASPDHPVRSWVRAPCVDLTLSFAAVLLFSAVFLVAGALLLGPAQEVPQGGQLIQLQERIVTSLHPRASHLYVLGVFLALAGTFYATVEVAPAVLREVSIALGRPLPILNGVTGRRIAIVWCALGGYGVLLWSWLGDFADGRPPELVRFITPAALFTGVLSCGVVCLVGPWIDRRFLPRPLRMGWTLTTLQVVGGALFITLGLTTLYRSPDRRLALQVLCVALVASALLSLRRR